MQHPRVVLYIHLLLWRPCCGSFMHTHSCLARTPFSIPEASENCKPDATCAPRDDDKLQQILTFIRQSLQVEPWKGQRLMPAVTPEFGDDPRCQTQP